MVACRAVSIQRVPDNIVVIVTSVPLTRRILSCSSSTVSGSTCRGGPSNSTVDMRLTPEPVHVHAVRRVVKSWPRLLLVHHVDNCHPTGDGRVGAGGGASTSDDACNVDESPESGGQGGSGSSAVPGLGGPSELGGADGLGGTFGRAFHGANGKVKITWKPEN